MKKINVKLSAYPSKYFPVKAVFTVNGTRYSLVFTTEEEARRYFENVFCYAKITFCAA